MTIYFFTKRIDKRIDYVKLLDEFFVELPNTSIKHDDEVVDIKVEEPAFNFEYHFYITKRNRLNNIQLLSRDYVNTNLLIELPILSPSYLVRKVLKVVSKLVEEFNLSIYYSELTDVSTFNMLDILANLDIERNNYIINHPKKYYYIDQHVMSDACSYLEIMEKISSSMKVEAISKPYDVLYDKEADKVVLSMEWSVGTPLIFPPHLDYVYVKEEGNLLSVIPYNVFFKYAKKFMHEIAKNKSIDYELNMDLYFLNEKNSNKLGKLVKKMRKEMVGTNRFEEIFMNEILEK